jgi:hypothetical protein
MEGAADAAEAAEVRVMSASERMMDFIKPPSQNDSEEFTIGTD